MATTERPRRADARRNHQRIMDCAGELFARVGHQAQMEEIAAHCGLGIGTLYRHFPSKQALLTAIVRARFEGMAELARAAEQISDPREALETILRDYLEAACGDATFQLALLGSTDIEWGDLAHQKGEFRTIVTRIVDRAVASGQVRDDLTFKDFAVIACGIMSTMYFKPRGNSDWRRHLELMLDGIRTTGSRA